MNERIRQLAEQAGYSPLPGLYFANELQEVFLNKFAALIVRDVLVICDAVSEPFEDPEMDKNIPGALVVAEMIRENFGVEE